MNKPIRTSLGQMLRLELQESLRSRWFHFYAAVAIGLMLLLIFTGVSESRVLGFTGLSRLLVTYIQITMRSCRCSLLWSPLAQWWGTVKLETLNICWPSRLGWARGSGGVFWRVWL